MKKFEPLLNEIKKSRLTMFFMVILIVSNITLGICLGVLALPTDYITHYLEKSYSNAYEDYINVSDPTAVRIANNCTNHDFEEDIKCVVGETRKVYDYVNHSGIRTPTETYELKGVCRDYSIYFCSITRIMNYNCKVEVLSDVKHAIAIVTSDEGYCVLDQTEYSCFYFDKS